MRRSNHELTPLPASTLTKTNQTEGKKNEEQMTNKTVISRCQLSDTYYLMPTIRSLLPDAHFQIPTIKCLLSDAYYQMPTIRSLLSDARYQMPTIRCSLLDTHGQMPTIRGSLSDSTTRFRLSDASGYATTATWFYHFF